MQSPVRPSVVHDARSKLRYLRGNRLGFASNVTQADGDGRDHMSSAGAARALLAPFVLSVDLLVGR